MIKTRVIDNAKKGVEIDEITASSGEGKERRGCSLGDTDRVWSLSAHRLVGNAQVQEAERVNQVAGTLNCVTLGGV